MKDTNLLLLIGIGVLGYLFLKKGTETALAPVAAAAAVPGQLYSTAEDWGKAIAGKVTETAKAIPGEVFDVSKLRDAFLFPLNAGLGIAQAIGTASPSKPPTNPNQPVTIVPYVGGGSGVYVNPISQLSAANPFTAYIPPKVTPKALPTPLVCAPPKLIVSSGKVVDAPAVAPSWLKTQFPATYASYQKAGLYK